ncbi:MAG: 1-deoxy-D-xylulose-5-phosphate synthase [Nitrospirae bacterium]|nr:1-deoxy-D-xylulose-5-phosphate synthase [Nitrospirota bacterium]
MMGLLEKINSPEDLKKIDRNDLPHLAEEIREAIIDVVSKNGGHLASNLGSVELSIAIHYIFNAPNDQIIWDVGHQAYTHKILTGRREAFYTLRQFNGISGFPRREESRYDVFNVGHSGTSISAALGKAVARDFLGENYKVIAVIGDGSMTAGLAFEALNQAGHLKKDIIVILNDNEMSISKNVGALSAYLNRIMTGQFYTRVKKETEHILKNIPKIGESMLKAAKVAEESVKGLIAPGILFEEMGFNYVGPIDGHRIEHLINTFENIKRLSEPILIHVVTKKGKGYKFAEKDPAFFHGPPPFYIETGEARKKSPVPSYTKIFGDTIIRIARENEKVIAISAAMPEGTGLDRFAKEFPNRFYDVGIAEQHGVTFAAGLAAEGFRPVVAVYSTFLQRAYDQIVHDVCLQNLPVVFAMDRAGIVGEDGPTHHGAFDIAYLRHIPNMVIMAPKDENELQHMLYTAVNHNGPIAIRYPRGEAIGVSLDRHLKKIEIGKGEIIVDGDDIAIIAIGNAVYPALDAAARLRDEGISVAVMNARFPKPLDKELIIDIAGRVKGIITVEENSLQGGFGGAVIELLSDEDIKIKVKRIGLPDKYIEHGAQKILRQKYGLDSDGICNAVKEAVTGEFYNINLSQK